MVLQTVRHGELSERVSESNEGLQKHFILNQFCVVFDENARVGNDCSFDSLRDVVSDEVGEQNASRASSSTSTNEDVLGVFVDNFLFLEVENYGVDIVSAPEVEGLSFVRNWSFSGSDKEGSVATLDYNFGPREKVGVDLAV